MQRQNDSAPFIVSYQVGLERMVALVSLLFGMALISLIIFGTYERKIELPGYIFPEDGQVNIFSRLTGQIEYINITEQQYVKKGDSLFSISYERATPNGRSQERISDLIDKNGNSLNNDNKTIATRHNAQLQDLFRAMENKKKQIENIIGQINISKKSIDDRINMLARYETLVKEGYMSSILLTEKTNELNTARGAEENLKLQKLQLEKELFVLVGERNDSRQKFQIDTGLISRETIKNAKDAILSETSLHETFVAPVDGYVTGLMIKKGQYIDEKEIVLAIIPKNSKYLLEMNASSKDVAFIKENVNIKIMYDAFPYQKFGIHRGNIQTVSLASLPKSNGQDKDIEHYRIVATINEACIFAYGRCEKIKPGMKAKVLIPTEKRSIASWMFNPMYSLLGQ